MSLGPVRLLPVSALKVANKSLRVSVSELAFFGHFVDCDKFESCFLLFCFISLRLSDTSTSLSSSSLLCEPVVVHAESDLGFFFPSSSSDLFLS
ncbi:hypothetical protein BpHYR1_028961 [Brachionus plicatilis]|uniref:Uncharacterized protein n=1 Tax=Brachionus plicatilis TaxID=10195 RepID=A0A3M7SGE5_BRAPC|nr:hypothetical protein BpHYR1_028961 [Brachionus plicatilis]